LCLIPVVYYTDVWEQGSEKIIWTQSNVVTGEWRRLHNEELHLYSSSNIRQMKSRRMKWAGHMARMGEKRKLYKVLVGKPEGNRPLERPRRG
jgi:hypothetical protein